MRMNEAFIKEGGWLFQWRSYVPLALAVVLLTALSHFTYPYQSHVLDTAWDFLALGISLFGLVIRIVTVGFVPRNTSGRNTKGQVADAINTTGMYSILRHPLYFGNFWIWFGASLFPRIWWCTLIVTLAFLLFYERIIFAEEEFLHRTFGTAFDEWAARTPAFWPKFRSWQPPEMPFSVRSVLRRENSTLFGIMSAFMIMETVGTVVVEHELNFDAVWIVLFSISAALYLVLKVMKKLKLLNVQGR